MPKPNKTLLDQLASIMKASGSKKPAIIEQTAWHDPLGYTIEQRRAIARNPEHFQKLDMIPERVVYQKGIDARLFPKMRKADELVGERHDDMDTFNDEWNEAAEEAKEHMKEDWEDWETGLDDQTFDYVDPYSLKVDAPSTDLRDYWPDYRRTPQEIYDDFGVAQDAYYAAKDEQRRLRRPETRMQEQMMTPRYRRYQDAMMQRAENARVGRLNAKIMHLARMGYTMPEIREILRMQGR
jgi:hypothetical protein